MQHVRHTKLKLYSIFMMALAAVLLAACSDDTAGKTTNEQHGAETAKVEKEKEIKDEPAEGISENQTTGEDQVEPAVPQALTLDEFINRWNKLEPAGLTGETQTVSVEDGILTGYGTIGSGDTYIFEVNEKDKTLQKVSLNLTYPLPEDGGGLGEAIPHNIRILMDTLEPQLSSEDKDKMLSTLLSSQIEEISVKGDSVTYTVRNGDDRFWLDAAF